MHHLALVGAGLQTSIARKSLTLVKVGPGTTRSPSALEEVVGVVAVEEVARLQAVRRGPRQRVGRDDRAGVVLDAVDAVGVGGEHVHVGLALQRDARSRAGTRWRGRRGPPLLFTVTVVSPPDSTTQGLANGWPRRAICARERRVHLADLARLAFDLVAEDVRGDAGARAASAAAASSDCCGVAIMCTTWPAKTGSPGLGVSNAPLSRPARAAGGNRDARSARGPRAHRRRSSDRARSGRCR